MIENLMTGTADVYRPGRSTTTGAEELSAYVLTFAAIPVSVQPMTSSEAFFYQQRGDENMATVYTTATNYAYQRNDLLDYTDPNGVEHQFHVLGVKNGLFVNAYVELSCSEYPNTAKKRLNKESYP